MRISASPVTPPQSSHLASSLEDFGDAQPCLASAYPEKLIIHNLILNVPVTLHDGCRPTTARAHSTGCHTPAELSDLDAA